tara:strand:- start:33765 stop:33944 length:180 start_codon:yes stop_codon:yes gene_type:complete
MYTFVHGGAKVCMAGHGRLTHIAVLLLIVKLATAGNGLARRRGRRRALLVFVICSAEIS